MSKKTPKRPSLDTHSTFSPITILTSPTAQSPQKNLTGPPRVIRDIIADLYNNIQRWNSFHVKGCALVKQIASLKADQSEKYPAHLEEYVNELYAVVLALKTNNDMFSVLVGQSEAFSKLPNVADPVFFSLSASKISEIVKEICDAYAKELQSKQFVLENIAHTKNKDQVMFMAAYWTHQLEITDKISFKLESLLLESGHRPIQ